MTETLPGSSCAHSIQVSVTLLRSQEQVPDIAPVVLTEDVFHRLMQGIVSKLASQSPAYSRLRVSGQLFPQRRPQAWSACPQNSRSSSDVAVGVDSKERQVHLEQLGG